MVSVDKALLVITNIYLRTVSGNKLYKYHRGTSEMYISKDSFIYYKKPESLYSGLSSVTN